MNTTITDAIPDEDENIIATLTDAVVEVPEVLPEAARKVVTHMARFTRRGKPYIIVVSSDGKNTTISGCNERLGFVAG